VAYLFMWTSESLSHLISDSRWFICSSFGLCRRWRGGR